MKTEFEPHLPDYTGKTAVRSCTTCGAMTVRFRSDPAIEPNLLGITTIGREKDTLVGKSGKPAQSMESIDFAWKSLEARAGIEPAHKGFADLSLTTWVPRLGRAAFEIIVEIASKRRKVGSLERETRFELATLALARRCSTTELLPLVARLSIPGGPNAVKPQEFAALRPSFPPH